MPRRHDLDAEPVQGGIEAEVGAVDDAEHLLDAFGLKNARQVVPDKLVEAMLAAGVLIYAGVGVAGLLLGGNFLDYFVLDHDPVHGQHRGIFWVEIGVAITVCGVMLKIFYMFAGRGNSGNVGNGGDPGNGGN